MQAHEPDKKITEFLNKLTSLDAGEKARLRRDAGKPLSEGHSLGLFYRLLPYGVSEWQEEAYFLVATLYPLAKSGDKGNFGAALRKARDPDKKKNRGLDRRVEILLDADTAQLPFRLRQAVRFIKSRNPETLVNWQQLLQDLLQWNSPSRWVQARWARSYFHPPELPVGKPEVPAALPEIDQDV